MSEKKYQQKLEKIQKNNESLKRIQLLKDERNKYRTSIIKKVSTTKLVMLYLFLLLNVILIFAMVAMWHFADLSYLGVLVTDIAAQIITFFIYAVKSTKENTVGGITYDLAMMDADSVDESIEEDVEESVS
jgi:hypothetical protein